MNSIDAVTRPIIQTFPEWLRAQPALGIINIYICESDGPHLLNKNSLEFSVKILVMRVCYWGVFRNIDKYLPRYGAEPGFDYSERFFTCSGVGNTRDDWIYCFNHGLILTHRCIRRSFPAMCSVSLNGKKARASAALG